MNKKKRNLRKMEKFLRINKKRKGNSALFLILFACALIVGFIFAYREFRKTPDKQKYTPYEQDGGSFYVTGKLLYYDNECSPVKKDDIWVMYQNLNAADQNVYDLFLDLVENREDSDYFSCIIVSDSKLKEIGDSHFWDVFHAMRSDHPEYFFLISDSPRINCTVTRSQGYNIYKYSMKEPKSWESEQISAFNAATEEFMSDIDLEVSDEEIELQIHDKLIDLVSYNRELYINSMSDDRRFDLGYTAYSALVSDSAGVDNYAVCNGYALAFELLMHKAGIPCGIITGKAYGETMGNTEGGGHAWNVVKIDDRWYEVDTTWDDFDPTEIEADYSVVELIKGEEEFLFNMRHHYFNRRTVEMENLQATEATVLNIPGYQPFNLRGTTSHIRDSKMAGDISEGELFLSRLIPIAQ
ncbi:transglutaminase domain-containing protein [Butyrivibrio sp. INlla21]|uniref:transglutaminase domain-containing protein n=1 Tax=Butyrivibrio sp. INlla21 TaxID=1520811 RepID=UPI0008EF2352|nr:transglutaminase domain-containing protein [Butyrivibrio sp. INlla21]SFV02536.1 Transglutaminase-like superfamily protein [Butyrivibrio sp. INlla21]